MYAHILQYVIMCIRGQPPPDLGMVSDFSLRYFPHKPLQQDGYPVPIQDPFYLSGKDLDNMQAIFVVVDNDDLVCSFEKGSDYISLSDLELIILLPQLEMQVHITIPS